MHWPNSKTEAALSRCERVTTEQMVAKKEATAATRTSAHNLIIKTANSHLNGLLSSFKVVVMFSFHPTESIHPAHLFPHSHYF